MMKLHLLYQLLASQVGNPCTLSVTQTVLLLACLVFRDEGFQMVDKFLIRGKKLEINLISQIGFYFGFRQRQNDSSFNPFFQTAVKKPSLWKQPIHILVLDALFDLSLKVSANCERTPYPNLLVLSVLFALFEQAILVSPQEF
jgi:hypothetical protein